MENISCQNSSLLTFCSTHKTEIGKMEEEETWKTHMDSNTEEVEGREGRGGKKDGRRKELEDGEGRESKREMRRVAARRERRINNPQTFPSKRPCKPKYQNMWKNILLRNTAHKINNWKMNSLQIKLTSGTF